MEIKMEKSLERIELISNHIISISDPMVSTFSDLIIEKYNTIQLMESNLQSKDILYRIYPNGCLKIMINRIKSLNCLNIEMVEEIKRLLHRYEYDPIVKFVIIVGAGDKSFCSGGDARQYESPYKAIKFSYAENQMNLLIHKYNKPLISIVNGIAMGLGGSLFAHSPFRIITENGVWAMPENKIGFVPDGAVTFQLSRLGSIGKYVALTGYRLKHKDLISSSLATHYISSKDLDKMMLELTSGSIDSKSKLESFLQGYSSQPAPNQQTPLETYITNGSIERCFGDDCNDVETIMERLEIEKNNTDKSIVDWATKTIRILNASRPLSLKVCFKALQKAKSMTIEQVVDMDIVIAYNICHHNRDWNGLNRIFDPTYKPVWNPPTIQLISNQTIENIFIEN